MNKNTDISSAKIELFECAALNARITEKTCINRLKTKKKHSKHPEKNPLLDRGDHCTRCPRGKQLMKDHGITFPEKIHTCVICGRSESEGAKFQLRVNSFNGKQYNCNECINANQKRWSIDRAMKNVFPEGGENS